MIQKRLVCLCNQVTAPEIKKILRAGALTTSEIQKLTSAGTSCGRCIREIDALLENHRKETIQNPQFRISFE
jgi:bacterioferritin-associated ferredoxin